MNRLNGTVFNDTTLLRTESRWDWFGAGFLPVTGRGWVSGEMYRCRIWGSSNGLEPFHCSCWGSYYWRAVGWAAL